MKLMINSPSLSTRIINVCFITVLLLVSSVASSQAKVSNTVNVVCVKTMEPAVSGVESADCCQLEESKACCSACHIAVYQTARAIQLSLMELSDESTDVTYIRLSSLNPPPLIRPPVAV